MKAIYKNKVYNVVESAASLTLKGAAGAQFDVEFGDDELVIDPTDYEVAAADNLAEHYGLDKEAGSQLERMLRGDISISEWEKWKAARLNS